MLSGEGQLMTPDHKKQFETHLSALVENMNPKAVTNRLCSYQALTGRSGENMSGWRYG